MYGQRLNKPDPESAALSTEQGRPMSTVRRILTGAERAAAVVPCIEYQERGGERLGCRDSNPNYLIQSQASYR